MVTHVAVLLLSSMDGPVRWNTFNHVLPDGMGTQSACHVTVLLREILTQIAITRMGSWSVFARLLAYYTTKYNFVCVKAVSFFHFYSSNSSSSSN